MRSGVQSTADAVAKINAPVAWQTLRYGLDPEGLFSKAHRRLGDVFRMRVFGESWIVLGHPDAVKEVFSHGPAELNSGEANQALRPLVGTRNVLLLDGEEHLQRRKMVLPPFHGERMRAYESMIRGAITEEISTWTRDEVFPVLPRMQSVTFSVILQAVFGLDDGQRMSTFATALREMLSWITDPRRGLIYAVLGPDRLINMRAFRRQFEVIDREIASLIAVRRNEDALEERQDILSLLMRAHDEDGKPLSDQDLRDELITLLVAGNETTSSLISWTMHEVARDLDSQDRLVKEGDEFIDAVITETLRLRPAVPVVLRRLREPLSIAGHRLAAGTTVAPSTLLVHRRPDLYPEPWAFRPERFLGRRPVASEWFPFGGSVRRCIGAAFAQFEARIVLEEVFRDLRLAPAQSKPERVGRRGVVLVPGRGARVIPTKR
jgi:cytochrome P450 family 135